MQKKPENKINITNKTWTITGDDEDDLCVWDEDNITDEFKESQKALMGNFYQRSQYKKNTNDVLIQHIVWPYGSKNQGVGRELLPYHDAKWEWYKNDSYGEFLDL